MTCGWITGVHSVTNHSTLAGTFTMRQDVLPPSADRGGTRARAALSGDDGTLGPTNGRPDNG